MQFKCAGIIKESYVDGSGIRLTVFVQGCNHHCFGCHNQHTWDYNGGYIADTNDIIKEYKSNPLLDGITISGGEPVDQSEPMAQLAKEIHSLGGNVWVYTGYIYEDIKDNILIKNADVVVDGPFILKLRDLTLSFKGSSNQRVIYRDKTN